jgi:DNA-binding GntR family transcriptional regulator
MLDARHRELKEAIRAQDQQLAISREMDLHGLVYEFADHRILLDSWKLLRGHLHLYFTLHQTAHGRAGALVDAHERYVELAKGEDLDLMLREVEEHMHRGLDRLREFVEEWNRKGGAG